MGSDGHATAGSWFQLVANAWRFFLPMNPPVEWRGKSGSGLPQSKTLPR
jgi:hypothetical protein